MVVFKVSERRNIMTVDFDFVNRSLTEGIWVFMPRKGTLIAIYLKRIRGESVIVAFDESRMGTKR